MLRGLGVVLPPLLTIVIFLWVGGTVSRYVLDPVTIGTRNVIAWCIAERVSEQAATRPQAEADYVRLPVSGDFVPRKVYDVVRKDPRPLPVSPDGVYRRYVEIVYLRPYVVIPVFLTVFILLLYLLGRFLAAGIGRALWNLFESGINRLPLVRNVYGSVKQVTDFMLNESEIAYTRVVAVEYPRRGIWSIGLVTSESLPELRAAAGEPVLAVLIPSSPMPVTGYTITVLRSEVIELNLSIDQALQFIVSCGVVVPEPAPAQPLLQSATSGPER